METRPVPAKRRDARPVPLVLAGLLLFAACRSPRTDPKSALRLAIEAEHRNLVERFQAGDLLGVADTYALDAEIYDARGTRTAGHDEIDALWAAIESPVAWSLETRSVRGSASLAYAQGTSRMTTRQGEDLVTITSDFLFVWRREADGPWRILLDAQWPRARD
jgi:ketosteroid isomerase-like protein